MAKDPGRAARIVGVVLCVLALSVAPASPQSCYGELAAARSYRFGNGPNGIGSGDFDSDGIPDLAVANSAAYSADPGIGILLGNGDGTLRSGTAITGLDYPTFVVALDLNRDGAVDLAVAGSFGEVFILLGDGNGAFAQAGSYATGYGSVWIVGQDVNGDGDVDLVTADSSDDTVTLLLGTGGGAFTVAGSLAAGDRPFAVAIADLDSDARLDLLTGNRDGTVSFLKGDGAGSFQAPIVYSAGYTSAAGMAVGLVNGDPFIDVAVALGSYPGEVAVLLGTGTGSFQQPRTFAAGYPPMGLRITDINGDGKADVLVAIYADALGILLGDGSGNLSAATSLASGDSPVLPIAVDLDRDGTSDVAVACIDSDTVSVLKGRPGALPVAAVSYDAAMDPIGVAALDADGDGDRDLVAVGRNRQLVVMTNDGSGAFQVGSPTGTSFLRNEGHDRRGLEC